MDLNRTILLALLLAAISLPAMAQDKPTEAADAGADAWMGVRVSPVPEALAAHLPLGRSEANPNVGLMVVNLVKDGPADVGGLRQYDVITHFDGELVTDELGRFVQQIGKHAPDEKVTLTVIRESRRKRVAITLGRSKPALSADYTYKYPEQPTGVFQQSSEFRGAVITRTSDGWQMQDFKDADPAMFKDLPDDVREKVMAWTGKVAPGKRTVVNRDGQSVEIRQDATGQITVRRSSRNDDGLEKVVAHTYSDVLELKNADGEAFALHQKIEADPSLAKPLTDRGEEATDDAEPGAGEEPAEPTDPDELARMLTDTEMYREQIRDYEAFLDQYTEYLRGRLDEDGEPLEDDERVPMMWRELLDRANQQQMQPLREFTVDPSGRIDVRIRKEAGDLVISFRNEEEMSAMYPKLYEQYRKLVASDE